MPDRKTLAAIFADALCSNVPAPTRGDMDVPNVLWCYRQADLIIAADNSDKNDATTVNDNWSVLLPGLSVPIDVAIEAKDVDVVTISDSALTGKLFTGNKVYRWEDVTLIKRL